MNRKAIEGASEQLTLSFLPHLDALDRHTAVISLAPGREPLVLGLDEVSGSGCPAINPRFIVLAVTVYC